MKKVKRIDYFLDFTFWLFLIYFLGKKFFSAQKMVWLRGEDQTRFKYIGEFT